MKLPVLENKNVLMPLSRNVGQVFRKMRLASRLSQRDVARLSEVARSDISKFERQAHRIYFDTLERLCVAIGVRPLLLIAKTEEVAY